MSYERIVQFNGDPREAINLARTILTRLECTVTKDSENSIELTSPIGSKKFLIFSKAIYTAANNEISLKIEYPIFLTKKNIIPNKIFRTTRVLDDLLNYIAYDSEDKTHNNNVLKSYKKSVPFHGDFAKVIEIVKDAFLQHAFKIINESDSSIELIGFSRFASNTLNPLVAISQIRIYTINNILNIEADLGTLSLRKAIKKIIVFLLGLSAFVIAIPALILFSKGNPITIQGLFKFEPLAIFFVIIFTSIIIYLNCRTKRYLDSLFNNMVNCGNNNNYKKESS